MIQKVTFTPQVQFTSNEAPAIQTEEVAIQDSNQNKDDKSGLIFGSLAALGAFGLGLITRKPQNVVKTIEKEVVKTVEKTLTPFEQQAIWQAQAKLNPHMQRAVQTSQNASKSVVGFINNSIPVSKSSASYGDKLNVNNELRPELKKLKDVILERAEKAGKHGKIKKGKGNFAQKYPKQYIQREIELSTVTPAEQAKYDREIAYQAPSFFQSLGIAHKNALNAEQRAQMNSIGNLIPGQTKEKLSKMALKADKLTDTVLDLPNGNVCVIENGKISKILDMNTQKGKVVEITDEKKIAKHLVKHNINVQDLLKQNAKNLQIAA